MLASYALPLGGVTLVIVAVSTPDFLEREVESTTRPVESVLPVEVLETTPDHCTVMVAPTTGRALRSRTTMAALPVVPLFAVEAASPKLYTSASVSGLLNTEIVTFDVAVAPLLSV